MFNLGEIVIKKNDASIAGQIQTIGSKEYGIEWFDNSNRITYHSEDDIERRPTSINPIDCFFNKKIGDYDSFLRTMTRERLYSPNLSKGKVLSDQILAFNASRTLFFPYQYKPLVKYISSENKRTLICDEVGLGKTIEAGLILLENIARVPTERVLIVCPSPLREKWAQEMKNRFALEFSIYNAVELTKTIKRTAENNEEETLFGIISYEAVRGGEIVKTIEENANFTFDMLIFDEAHRLRNTSTRQHKIAKILCERADGVVMLTATPIQMSKDDLVSLLRLLLPNEFYDNQTTKIMLEANENIVKAQALAGKTPPNINRIDELLNEASKSPWFRDNPWMKECNHVLSELKSNPQELYLTLKLQENLAGLNLIGHVYTRTKKREVITQTPKRDAKALSVCFTEEERIAYYDVLEAVRAALEVENPLTVSWIMNNIERRVASCLPAALTYFREIILDMPNMLDAWDEEEDYDYYTDETVNEKSAPQHQNAVNKFYDVLKTKKWLKKQNISNSGEFIDSKAKKLLDLIEDLRMRDNKKVKIIVFASFRKTLHYLHEVLLGKGYRVYTIHGDIKMSDRPGIIDNFRDDDSSVSVLLSSRVGGEGLDMQFTDTIVNYDLPWNPMEVEQRIGRIDRIGQESPVIFIYHFFLDDTLEERILNRLYERIGIFEGAIGELEPILGNVVKEVIGNVSIHFSKQSELVDADYEDRIDRILAKYKIDLEFLEKESASFIGTDSFFTEEVKRIADRQLYITSEQMRLFFTNFLKEKCPSSHWDYDPKSKIGVFKPSSDFGELQQKFFNEGKNIVHRHFITGRNYQITFDRDTAYKTPGKAEFINNLHPIVRLMINVFEHHQGQEQSSFDSAFHILLRKNENAFGLGIGFYVFEIGRIDIGSYIPYNRLELVILDENGNVMPTNKAEELFAIILNNGHNPVMPLPAFDGEGDENSKIIRESHEILSEVLRERTQRLKEEIERKNIGFLENRKASLTLTYERKKEHLEEQIKTRTSKGESEKTLRLPKGQLHKLEEKYKVDVEALEKKRNIEGSWGSVAFGILEVCEHDL